MSKSWYVLRSKPRKEEFLLEQLLSHKIEAYCPRIRVQPVNPRARKIKPYLPGYVFVHLNLEKINLSTLQWMPGATGLVSFGGQPAFVHDSLIQAVRNRVDEINAAGGELLNALKPGDEVSIEAGPFAGYEAIFDTRLSGSERVRVLLKMMSDRYVPTDIAAGQIKRKKPS